MVQISELLNLTAKNKASDLHLSSKKPPMMRIHGDMAIMSSHAAITPDEVKMILYSVMTENQRTDYERELEIDFALSLTDAMRFRVNAFTTSDGPAAVFRLIPNRIVTLEQVNAPPLFAELTHKQKGLILVTGPTGSGKSTTLAAMVNHMNETQKKHIITIEDPIEFVHESKTCLINQREVGSHTKSFSRALKSALREDPDAILVGELRDLETIQLAMTAAETGHIVFATLHTSSAPKTIDRIIDVFPMGEKEMVRSMLSNSLEAIITQTLIKRKDAEGRIAAHEILVAIPSVRNLIREGKIAQMSSIMQMNARNGMTTMKDSIYKLAQEGIIDKEIAKATIAEKSVDDNNDPFAKMGSGSSF